MQPFCAPLSRSIRVSRRVSRSAMPTMSWATRYAPRSPVERKFDTSRGKSRMTSPAANGRRDSTSSALTPTLPMCGYVSVTICPA
jgi:hypothetical protein